MIMVNRALLSGRGKEKITPNSMTLSGVQFTSVQLLSPVRLCNPMDCSTPGFPVHHQLLEFIQTHVHWVGNAIWPFHPLLSPSSPTFNLPQQQSLFKMSQLFISGGQSIGASTWASVLPMNIQGWFPLRLTGLITLLSKGPSRIFSSTQSTPYPTSHTHYRKNTLYKHLSRLWMFSDEHLIQRELGEGKGDKNNFPWEKHQ